MSPAHWEAWERREQGALGGQPDTDTRQTLPGSRACHPDSSDCPSLRDYSGAGFRARLGCAAASIPHLLGLRSNPNPCRGLATPRPQAHRMDAPITRRQAQPGSSTRMPAAAPLASVAHHRRPGAHTARGRLHTHAPNRQRTAGQTEVKDSSYYPTRTLLPGLHIGWQGRRARAPARACKP